MASSVQSYFWEGYKSEKNTSRIFKEDSSSVCLYSRCLVCTDQEVMIPIASSIQEAEGVAEIMASTSLWWIPRTEGRVEGDEY